MQTEETSLHAHADRICSGQVAMQDVWHSRNITLVGLMLGRRAAGPVYRQLGVCDT